jgi:hypothetical protein
LFSIDIWEAAVGLFEGQLNPNGAWSRNASSNRKNMGMIGNVLGRDAMAARVSGPWASSVVWEA